MDIYKSSIVDLSEDFAELIYLFTDTKNKLTKFKTDLIRIKKYLAEITFNNLKNQTEVFIKKYSDWILEIENLKQSANISEPDENLILSLMSKKSLYYDLWRTHQSLVANLITSTDWQSPTFSQSNNPQAGRLIGKIHESYNDYKRDQHEDAFWYENKFLHEYVDGIFKFPVHTYATHTGMAAFTTIFNYLILENILTGYVIVGKSVYFECKEILKNYLGDKFIEVDESDTVTVINAINKYQPQVLFFDSIGNDPEMVLPDLEQIAKAVKSLRRQVYFILDNSCLSITCQPLKYFGSFLTNVNLIVFESLNKFHQFGADRVFGGIIWTTGSATVKLFDYRVHLGTNISDSAVIALPTPNRQILDKRLNRLFRNNRLISSYLKDNCVNPNSVLNQVRYPGKGAFQILDFLPKYKNLHFYKHFVDKVIKIAKKFNFDIVSGTSFGFNTTRIYLTAIKSKITPPFIRIAVGTENISEIIKLQKILFESSKK
jgi:cystathionine beta-lyase/cystathionine gamma-synthase